MTRPTERTLPMEGDTLPAALDSAVPLWILQFLELTPEDRQKKIAEVTTDDFCLRLEYVMHRGPQKGDTARAFNDLAQAIALLAFAPGGVCVFGRHWDAETLFPREQKGGAP